MFCGTYCSVAIMQMIAAPVCMHGIVEPAFNVDTARQMYAVATSST
jgi:hypothetical protein